MRSSAKSSGIVIKFWVPTHDSVAYPSKDGISLFKAKSESNCSDFLIDLDPAPIII